MAKLKTARLYVFGFFCALIFGLLGCKVEAPSEGSAPVQLQAADIPDRRFSEALDDWPHSISDLVPDPRAKFGRLENGLRYVILPVADEKETVSIQLNVSAGFNDEPEGLYGIAHLLEHMAFRGARSETDGSIIHDMQSAGIRYGRDFNGFTSTDNTYYVVDLPSNAWFGVETALQNVSQLVVAPNLSEENLQLEKKVVLAELKSRDTLSSRTQRSLRQFQFPDQPREAVPGSGTEESLKAISLSDVEAFYATHYRPDNILLIVTGGVKSQQTEKAIERLFADWSSGKPDARKDNNVAELEFSNFPVTESYVEEHAKTQVDAIENLPFDIGNDTLETLQNRYSEWVVLFIFKQRLNKIIDADDSVTWIAPFKTRYPEYDIRGLRSGAKDYPQMMTYFETERLRMLKYGFTQDEIDFAIASGRVLLENLVEQDGIINAWDEANKIRNFFVEGKVYTNSLQELKSYDAFVQQSSADDFHDAAKEMWGDFKPRYWSQSRKSMLDILEDVRAVPEVVSKLDIEAPKIEIRSDFKLRVFPDTGEIASRDVVSKNIHRLLYENGVRLNYQRSNQEPDDVKIQVTLKSDLSRIMDRYAAIAERLGAFSRADIKGASKEDIDRALIGKKAEVFLTLDEDRVEMSIWTRQKDLKTALDLMATYITDVDLDSEYQAESISSMKSKVSKNSRNSPLSAGFYKLYLTYSNRSPVFKSHWSGVPAIDGKVESDIQDIIEDGPIEVGIVGDFDPAILEAAFAESLGALPKREVIEKAAIDKVEKAAHKDPGLSTIIYGGTEDQMGLYYCWPRPMPKTTEDMVYWRMTDEIMKNRVVATLREDLAATYSPIKLRYSNTVFPNFQHSCFGVQIDPEEESKVHVALAALINDIKTVPVKTPELDRAREPQKSMLKKHGDSNAFLLRSVSRAYSQPEKLNEATRRQEVLKRLKLNRLNETMVSFFDRSDVHIFRVQHYQSPTAILQNELKVKSDLGDIDATYALGKKLRFKPDASEKKLGYALLDKAAMKGHEASIYLLAQHYRDKDMKKSASYLELSTKSPKSAYALAELYFREFKTFPDIPEETIMAHYKRSAEGGWARGQYGLAERLKDGTITERDEIGALKWALISNHMERGELSVVDKRGIERFVTGLTQDQLDAAQKQAEQWVKANPKGSP